ncbi:MAG TPA: DUF1566 domain-containing protein [Saprospiraceae bacterium]|nr:DUF1566 domain-containing protein [Saprospiraceae bacterium]
MISIRQAGIILFMTHAIILHSQRMGIGTNNPAEGSILDITSIEKGLLIPRMTSAQRQIIGTPATGLLVFDNTTSTFWFHNPQDWTEMKSQWVQDGDNIYNANSGSVGIGLTNPTARLEVNGNIRSRRPGSSPDGSVITFSSPGGDPGIIFELGNGSGGQLHRWDLKIDNDESFRIRDNSAGSDRLVIKDNGNIGIGTTAPHASAALHLSSTERGFLPPRMTKAQRVAIASPAEGLMIWCTDCGTYGETQVYNGADWTNMLGNPPAGLVIGDNFQGGKVAYIYQSGDPGYVAGEIHGLIATLSSYGFFGWGCSGIEIDGAEGTTLGTGNQNTLDIVNDCGESVYAALDCYDLSTGGYTDWHLPSKDELNKLYINKTTIGGFFSSNYWSSSEDNSDEAWEQHFGNGNISSQDKITAFYIRPVRYF